MAFFLKDYSNWASVDAVGVDTWAKFDHMIPRQFSLQLLCEEPMMVCYQGKCLVGALH